MTKCYNCGKEKPRVYRTCSTEYCLNAICEDCIEKERVVDCYYPISCAKCSEEGR